MHTEQHRWHSPALGREMSLLVFGHAGARVIVFPTSMGTCHEWPDRRMHEILGEHLHRGWIQLWCVDQVNDETWNAEWKHPGARAWRHLEYDRYLAEEVVPLTLQRNGNPFLMTTGASLGAYQAACFGLRHPDLVGRIIGLSGLYDITRLTGGYTDENVHACNPVAFVPAEHDHGRLEAMRRLDIILAVGEGDPACDNNRDFSGVLWDRGIGNALRIWDGWAHDWPWWERMILQYIGGHD